MSGPIEPSSDSRRFASSMFDIFVALVAAGFTEQQALAVVGHVIAAGIANSER